MGERADGIAEALVAATDVLDIGALIGALMGERAAIVGA
jgi:hypothetical protein